MPDLIAAVLTQPQQEAVVSFLRALNVPDANWFIGEPAGDGAVEVIAIGRECSDTFLCSLWVKPDGQTASSEARVIPDNRLWFTDEEAAQATALQQLTFNALGVPPLVWLDGADGLEVAAITNGGPYTYLVLRRPSGGEDAPLTITVQPAASSDEAPAETTVVGVEPTEPSPPLTEDGRDKDEQAAWTPPPGYAGLNDDLFLGPDELPRAGEYAIKVNGEEIDHADTRAEAKRARDTIIYGGIGTEANTTIEPKSKDDDRP